MRAIVIGAVDSSRVAIEAIAAAPGWSLPLVVSLEPSLSRRHSDFVDLAPVATAAGARFAGVANINDPSALALIDSAEADYIFVIGWSQICGEKFRAILPERIIGYHPAPLPRLRGRAAIPWTILTDEPITGATLFWIDDGVDSGAILEQRFFHVRPGETATSLYARHMGVLAGMMASALAQLAGGAPQRQVQDEACATWAARRTPADGQIDWTQPAAAVERLIRAVSRPYPGATTSVGDADLTIWAARIEPGGDRHLALPGQVLDRREHEFTVMCGDGQTLAITDWHSTAGATPARHARLKPRTRATSPG